MTGMWTGAEAYDQLMGRWSRKLAPLLIEFAEVQNGDRVLDVGCGTGSLSRTLLELMPHSEVVGVDRSNTFIEHGRQQLIDPRVSLAVGDVQSLPYPDARFDKCLSLLVLNHVPDARRAAGEMCRVTRAGGTVAAAVWDYGEGMEMFRILWDTAVALDPAAESKHDRNSPYCRKGELAALWTVSGLQQVEETSLVITLEFNSFQDYWTPFLTRVSRSSSYVSDLPAERQRALQDRLRDRLLGGQGGRPFTLQARAWAVRGTTPKH
jgi:SAM-dependent methyltransferase